VAESESETGLQLMHGVLLRTPSSLDDAWKRRVAASVLSSLTDARCQRSVCFTAHLSYVGLLHRSLVSSSVPDFVSTVLAPFFFSTMSLLVRSVRKGIWFVKKQSHLSAEVLFRWKKMTEGELAVAQFDLEYKSSAVAEMGDHLATIDMGRKVGGLLCSFLRRSRELGAHLTQCSMCRGLPPCQVAS